MSPFQLTYVEVGVNVSGIEGAVTEHLLNGPDIGFIFKHAGGAGVPEGMGSDALFTFYPLSVFSDQHPDGVMIHLVASGRKKERPKERTKERNNQAAKCPA